MKYTKEQIVWVLLRLSMGWIFFWAFIDKLLGLGFATTPDKAWIVGGSPTLGFLKFGTHGPLAVFYQGLAGNAAIDWLFMLGLLFVGIAFLLGIANRLAGYIGALMMLMIYTSVLLPENNPFMDEHLIYILVFLLLGYARAGKWFGLADWWENIGIVKKMPLLK